MGKKDHEKKIEELEKRLLSLEIATALSCVPSGWARVDPPAMHPPLENGKERICYVCKKKLDQDKEYCRMQSLYPEGLIDGEVKASVTYAHKECVDDVYEKVFRLH